MPATGVQSGIVLAAPATVRVESSFAILSSLISGTGPLTKIVAGSLQFGGASANTFTDDTRVNAGELVLNKPAGTAAIPGHLVIGSGGGGIAPFTTVRHFTSFTILGSVTVNRAQIPTSTSKLTGQRQGIP